MRVFKGRKFHKFCQAEKIADNLLLDAVRRANRGLIDADLGGGLIKQRVARLGQGRSTGFRTVVIYRSGTLAVFVAGFAKSSKDNLQIDELRLLHQTARKVLKWNDREIEAMLTSKTWEEIETDGEDL